MDLVVDEMVQLEHVDHAHRHLAVEGLAGAAVIEHGLAGRVEAGLFQHDDNVGLAGAVEHRRRDRHAARQMLRDFEQLGLLERSMSSILAPSP